MEVMIVNWISLLAKQRESECMSSTQRDDNHDPLEHE
jgi:hypothetical protein